MVTRVAVVEDDALMRLAISAAVKLAKLEVAFEAATGAEAVARFSNQSADVAILDLHLGKGPTGIDVARVFRRDNPRIGLVFLTSFEDPRLLDASLNDLPPFSHYLTKASINNVETLIGAIHKALTRSASTEATPNHIGELSTNQIEMLKLVAQGLSNAEIAKIRFITEKSVEVSISRIAKALGVAFEASTNQRVHMARVYFRAAGKSFE